MSRLPRHIAHWTHDLRDARAPHWLLLEQMAESISQALGRASSPRERDDGEPDGYDGVSRNGPWERMLLSQWALAESAPDELLRRIANHEVSFLKMRHQQPRERHRTLVILDTGPDQLGPPRIAHLALLLALRSRARDSRTTLSWGVLGDSHHIINDDFTRDGVINLLNARTLHPWGPDDVTSWTEHLTDNPRNVWWVGSPELASQVDPGYPLVTIEEELYRDALHLRLRLRLPHRDSTHHLPVPDDRICQKLLGRPFATPAPRNKYRWLGPVMPTVLIAVSRQRVILRESEGRIRSEHLPHTDEAQGKCRLFTFNLRQIIAVIPTKRTLQGIVYDDKAQKLELWRTNMLGSIKLDGATLALPPAEKLLLGFRLPSTSNVPDTLLVDQSGSLWRLRWVDGKNPGSIAKVPDVPQIIDVLPHGRSPSLLTQRSLGNGVTLLQVWRVRPYPSLHVISTKELRLEGLVHANISALGLVVTQQTTNGREALVVTSADVRTRFHLAEDETALGVLHGSLSPNAMLLLGDAGRTVYQVTQTRGREKLFATPWPPAQITMTPDGTRVVLLSVGGELASFDLIKRSLLRLDGLEFKQ